MILPTSKDSAEARIKTAVFTNNLSVCASRPTVAAFGSCLVAFVLRGVVASGSKHLPSLVTTEAAGWTLSVSKSSNLGGLSILGSGYDPPNGLYLHRQNSRWLYRQTRMPPGSPFSYSAAKKCGYLISFPIISFTSCQKHIHGNWLTAFPSFLC